MRWLSRKAQRDLALEHTRLDARSRKLLDAHLDGAIPADLYKEEQQAISRQLAEVAERLGSLSIRFDDLESNLEIAIELASNCYEAYRRAPDTLRRTYNQAFFKRILIWEDEPAEGELQDLFEVVFTAPAAGKTTKESEEAENTGFSASKGSKDEHLVPLEGLEPPTVSLGRNCSSIELQRLARRV